MVIEADPQAAFQPPLNEILRLPDEELRPLLDKRRADLGIATLPTTSMLLLKQLLGEVELTMASQVFGPHPPTLRAWEKQKLLPWGTHVQKTTTLRFDGKLFPVCSIGDQRFRRREQRAIATYLGISSHKEAHLATLNPSDVDAESLGFRQGIVSPFLQDGYWKSLHALVQLAWPQGWGDQNVAVSLDPYHTLLIPLRFYGRILCRYVPQHVVIYFLDGGEIIVTSGRRP